jgi:hypothetical protein
MALEPAFNSATQVDWARACERETVIRPLAQAVRLESRQVEDAAMRLDLVAVRLTGSSLFSKDDRKLPLSISVKT